MTGEPRGATVAARTEATCYRLDKGSFQDMIVMRPAIAEDISRIIASRRFGLDAVRQNLSGDAANTGRGQLEVLAKIRRFFGLSTPH